MEYVILLLILGVLGGAYALAALMRSEGDPEPESEDPLVVRWRERLLGEWHVQKGGKRVEWILFLKDGTYVWVYGQERTSEKGEFQVLDPSEEACRVDFRGNGGHVTEAGVTFTSDGVMLLSHGGLSNAFIRETKAAGR